MLEPDIIRRSYLLGKQLARAGIRVKRKTLAVTLHSGPLTIDFDHK